MFLKYERRFSAAGDAQAKCYLYPVKPRIRFPVPVEAEKDSLKDWIPAE